MARRAPSCARHDVHDTDAEHGPDAQRISRKKTSDKGTASARKRVDPERRRTGPTREAVTGRVAESPGDRGGLTRGGVGDEEPTRADEPAATRPAPGRRGAHPEDGHRGAKAT